MMRTFLGIALILIFAVSGALAKDIQVKSAAGLAALQLQPGDRVILTGNDWKDQHLVFRGKGTEQKPIRMITDRPGKLKLSGNSTLRIDGEWLEAVGLLFQEGYSQKEDVVLFSDKSAHCRLTNSAIIDYNNPDEGVDYKWVSLNGTRNRVDHCYFKGKRHQGTTLVVWLSDRPNYHQIDHNYFGPRPELGRNGGETIRIGTSTWSFHDSFTTVENNIFEHCDGEIEAISNKSCKNTIRNNLFYECKATLTLRHGNQSEVYGNFFVGNNKPGTGGIRIIGENHKVQDNHMQELSGTGLSAAISVMAGLPNPELTSHWQVKNASITGNALIYCKESFAIGAGYNAQRYLPPLNTIFADNVIISKQDPIKWYDDKVKVTFRNNTVWGIPSSLALPEGFSVKDPGLKKDDNGLYTFGSRKIRPFWKSEKIGPAWLESKYYQIQTVN